MIDKFKNYFNYNKKDRNGILLLSFVLFLLIIFYQFTYLFVPNTKTDFSEFENLLSELEYEKEPISLEVKDSLFYFNRNTLNDNGWISFTDTGDLLVLDMTIEDVVVAWGIKPNLNVGFSSFPPC